MRSLLYDKVEAVTTHFMCLPDEQQAKDTDMKIFSNVCGLVMQYRAVKLLLEEQINAELV